MTLNSAYIGKVYPITEPYLVGREKVREFARAIGEDHPAHHDLSAARALGLSDLLAPPTFPFVMTMRAMSAAMFDPEIGLDYARVVHGEQSFDYVRPLVAGDEVVVHSSIEAIDSSGRNEFMTVRADVRSVTGEPVVTTRSVLVSRGTGLGAPADRPSQADAPGPGQSGDLLAFGTFPVRRENLIEYCGASGDFNPIHWNERVAKAVGLPNVIAHGMFTMAQVGRAVTGYLDDPTRWEAFSGRFTAPVVVPDDDQGAVVEVTVALAERLPEGRVRLNLTATVDGVAVLGNAQATSRVV
jgi:acyl dehydratase